MIRSVFCVLLSVAAFPVLAEGVWKRLDDVNPMNDERVTAIATESVQPVHCGFAADFAQLQFQCQREDLAIAVLAPDCVFESEGVWNYRLDSAKASVLNVNTYNDPSVAFLSDFLGEGENLETIVKMLAAKRMLLEIRPFAQASEIVEFDLSSLGDQMMSGFDACLPPGWSGQTSEGEISDKSGTASLPGPRASSGLDSLILEELACTLPPDPGLILSKLSELGKIDPTKNIGFDSLSCFEIKGGLPMGEISFSHVCGYEEDDTVRSKYPGLFFRGPGTSPGQSLSFETEAAESDVRDWYARYVSGTQVDNGVSAKWPNFAKTAVSCDSWMLK